MGEEIYLILKAGGKEKNSFMVYQTLIWWLFINNFSKSSLALGFRETLDAARRCCCLCCVKHSPGSWPRPPREAGVRAVQGGAWGHQSCWGDGEPMSAATAKTEIWVLFRGSWESLRGASEVTERRMQGWRVHLRVVLLHGGSV